MYFLTDFSGHQLNWVTDSKDRKRDWKHWTDAVESSDLVHTALGFCKRDPWWTSYNMQMMTVMMVECITAQQKTPIHGCWCRCRVLVDREAVHCCWQLQHTVQTTLQLIISYILPTYTVNTEKIKRMQVLPRSPSTVPHCVKIFLNDLKDLKHVFICTSGDVLTSLLQLSQN